MQLRLFPMLSKKAKVPPRSERKKCLVLKSSSIIDSIIKVMLPAADSYHMGEGVVNNKHLKIRLRVFCQNQP